MKNLLTMNIGLIGSAAVGKTTIIHKFKNPGEKNISSLATIGVNLTAVYLNFMGEPIKIKMWDTAGQEKFASLTESYVRNLDGVLLVFALNNDASFD